MPRAMLPSMPTLASTSPQWPGIDTIPVSPTPMHDSIGSDKKKKRAGSARSSIFLRVARTSMDPSQRRNAASMMASTDNADLLCKAPSVRRTTSMCRLCHHRR